MLVYLTYLIVKDEQMKLNFFILTCLFLLIPESSFAASIGWVTDIHAGNADLRNAGSETGNIQQPKNYDVSFHSVLSELKNKSVDLVIATGDNTNNSEDKYADDLLDIAKDNKIKVLWTKGNHDGEETLDEFGLAGVGYYYHDYGNIRIIVLNNTEIYEDYYGGISQKQLDWLQQAIITEKDIIVALHIPVFQGKDDTSVMDRYQSLEQIISSSPRVKLVLGGHYHMNFETEINGVKHKILQPLTKKEKNRSYGLINTDDYSVEYLIAKQAKYKDSKKKSQSRYVKSKSKVKKGEILSVSGKNFSKNSDVSIFFSKPDGTYSQPINVKTDKKGKFSAGQKIATQKSGVKYDWYAVDKKTGKKSKKVKFKVS